MRSYVPIPPRNALAIGSDEIRTVRSVMPGERPRRDDSHSPREGLLLLVLLLVLLFGALGVAISPLFFILLVAVLLIAGTGGRRWSSRW